MNMAKFRGAIGVLISKTPTSDLRNELTDLNILFESISNDIE